MACMSTSKKIFLDIGHPAHVHYFKHLIREMEGKGHSFVITARDKEVTHFLLEKEGFSYTSRGSGKDGLFGKLLYTIKADRQLYRIAKREKPDLFLSFASPYCAHAAWLMRKPHIVLDDTETAHIGQALYRPFSDVILTPESFKRNLGKKQLRYPSFIETGYLHPKWFNPDPAIYKELGMEPGQPYTIMRFVAWTANHDVWQKGISIQNRIKAAEEFSKYGRVFISSEKKLPAELNPYCISISPERIHHAIAFSSLMFGESGTMTSEAAMLGTPAVFINNLHSKLGTIKTQAEIYKLVFPFSESEDDQLRAIEKGVEILNTSSEVWEKRKTRLFNETIDITDFLEWFLIHYPDSIESVRNGFRFRS